MSKRKLLWSIVVLLFACFIGVMLIPSSPTPPPQSGTAMIMCQKFVKDRLNTQAVEFSKEKPSGIKGEPVNHYAVFGVATVDNVSKDYRCDLHHSNDASRWFLDNLIIN